MDIFRFTMLALLATPVVALAQGAYSLAPFPTVAQLTSAIRAQTAVIEKQDGVACKLAYGECVTQGVDQLQMLNREEHYWHGDYDIAEAQRQAEAQTLAYGHKHPSALSKEAREIGELSLSEWKRKCDLLLADRELLRQQRQLIYFRP